MYKWTSTSSALLLLSLMACNGGEKTDTNQDTVIDNDEFVDEDGDGFRTNSDCDDSNADINPDALDVPNDGIDQDCDGEDETGLCDDSCDFANDGACDDGGIDSDYAVCDLGTDCSDCGARKDNDGDGFYDIQDCDDDDPDSNPAGMDLSGDGIDQDCDGEDFEGLCSNDCIYADDGACDDGGFESDFSICMLGTDCGDCGGRIDSDEDGFDNGLDCDDENPLVNPEAPDDTCDGVDDNCDGIADEDWKGDTHEPNDTENPTDLVELEENEILIVEGYISDENESDAFQFYCEDGFGPDFGFSMLLNNPSQVMDLVLTIQFIDENGNKSTIATVDSQGLGGSESFNYSGGSNDNDSGTYIVSITSKSGADCSAPFKLVIEETGLL